MNPYENIVLENKYNSILDTKIDMNAYLTADRSLSESAGMVKRVNTYTASGSVEDLAKGVGNSESIEASYISNDYRVGVTQGRFPYYDEDLMTDPSLIDAGLKGIAEIMANDLTKKAIGEMEKGTQTVECDFSTASAGYFFGKVVDALALFGEEQEGLTLLISPKVQAYVRKQLGEDLKYSEGFARTGYIGSVAGIPVVVSEAVPDSCAIIVNKEAVTAFLKKDTEAEQERDANTRKNTLYMRKVAVVALTNAKKVAILGKPQTTSVAITTSAAGGTTVAGTCGTSCHLVTAAVGSGAALPTTPSAGAWTITVATALASGQIVTAAAYEQGYAASVATATVA